MDKYFEATMSTSARPQPKLASWLKEDKAELPEGCNG